MATFNFNPTYTTKHQILLPFQSNVWTPGNEYDILGNWIYYKYPELTYGLCGSRAFRAHRRPRGVGEHPHRGFETVTLVYAGEVAHRDSAGNGGLIGPGDVQWMTAASGLVHEEFHSPGFTRRGGTLEMAQLWVNLPAKHKTAPPRYQTLESGQIPDVATGRCRAGARVAGEFAGRPGPARTYTPVNVWDVRLAAGAAAVLPTPRGHTTAVAVLKGTITVNGTHTAGPAALLVFEREGDQIRVRRRSRAGERRQCVAGPHRGAHCQLIVGYGPFVNNTREEIVAAMQDFQRGKFGVIAAPP